MKTKLLFILHTPPPNHGAAKVGEFIVNSKKINNSFECKFISIKSSDNIGDIGKIQFKKFFRIVELYFKILKELIIIKPDKIYFTSSIKSVAFYRDLLLSTLWKTYKKFKKCDIYYHYHTKGVNEYISKSQLNKKLTNFFVKDTNIILLSPMLKKDIEGLSSYKNIYYLPNGVENNLTEEEFEKSLIKYKKNQINMLFLSNMIKSKGYFDVVLLAKDLRQENVIFHFAGGWQNESDKNEFFEFIEKNNLKNIIFHGYVSGKKKKELFLNSHFLIYPSKNDAFPLTLCESLSYGIPVIASDEGSIPYIIDKNSGVIIRNINTKNLKNAFYEAKKNLLNKETAKYCRKRYLENFTLEKFEDNLINILKG
ncbi:glycosyltransferase family 4 protein [Caminibacter mediatlanticus TB-2]|uniref:Glycosyltransferase family 4 protein n=1 Tax=Caminibacter mediatlanticus TB-2 TaxID=391592 RepID=A0ABX5V7L1_9BACT|nr:glycosyltransferase family 4 protein [Caminibacter mediatlanticus]QCT93964.1 glycosyltransferase family 4 protein [Caminibacter mediatlanticus TB-2]